MIDPTKKLDRVLMFIPGFLSWSMLLFPIWLGIFAPETASFILTFLAVYWVYMATSHAYWLYRGYKKYKEESAIDWWDKVKNLDYSNLPTGETLPQSFHDLKHIILIPTYKEDIKIIEPVFQAIMDSLYDIDKVLVVIGTEEKGQDIVTPALEQLQKKYGDKLPKYWQFIHPVGIPHEIVGVASPNRTWAAKHAVDKLIAEGADPINYIFTTFDADTVIDKQFLARVTYAYLTESKRFNKFFETCVRVFNNNFWEVPLLSRIEASNLTFGILARKQTDEYQSESFSCYSCALQTLVDANYWDVKFIDDTVFFWRAYIAREGDFSHHYFYIPVSCDATSGSNYVRAHINLFRQLVRWGWGSVTSVIALKYFIKEKFKKGSFENKFIWTYAKLERHLVARTSAYLITFGFFVVTLVNEQFTNSSTVYRLPQIISIFLSAGMFMLIPLTFIRRKIYPPPQNLPLWKKIFNFIEGPFVIINLLTYSFIPWIYAETLMMFGKLPKVTFYTPKIRE